MKSSYWFNLTKYFFVFIVLITLFSPMEASAQDMQDVIYLNNGSIIRGTIIEQVPNDYYKIKTGDGSVFIYYAEDVEKIAKERPIKSTTSYTGGSRSMRSKAIQLNPLGFLQFGPTVEGQFEISPNIYLTAHLRYSALGLIYQALESDGFEDDVSFGSAALGAGFIKFFDKYNSPNLWYVGGFAEYGWGATNNSSDAGEHQWEGEDSQFILAGNVGHRWRYPSNFFLNIGAQLGGVVSLKSEWWYLDTPSVINEGDDFGAIFFMLELSLGWEL